MRWFMVHTNNGWRVFSEELRELYLPTISSGESQPIPTEHVLIEMPGSEHPERQARFYVDRLAITTPREDLPALAAMVRNMEPTLLGERVIFKLRGRMEGVVLTDEQRWILIDQMHRFMKETQ